MIFPKYKDFYQVTAVGGNKRLKLANLRKVPIKSSSHPLSQIPLISPLHAALNHICTGSDGDARLPEGRGGDAVVPVPFARH